MIELVDYSKYLSIDNGKGLLLNRNDYGITQFGTKALIIIDEKISNEKYKEGSLVIVEKKKISELNVGDEIFVYKSLDICVCLYYTFIKDS